MAVETATAFFVAWMNILMVGVEHNVVQNVAGSLVGWELEILVAGIRWVVVHGSNRTLTRSG